MPFISIIIPTYNRSMLLVRALESVYKQTYIDYEVIVVDDGSNDNTAEMIEQKFPEIRCFQQANKGVSAARNMGLTMATGEWIAFLDSDDEWLPDKLEKQLNTLQHTAGYKVCHTEEIWIRQGVRVNQMKKHKKQGGWIFPQCLPLCAMSPSSVLIHSTVFDEVGEFDITLPACEDYDLWLRIAAKFPVVFIEQPLIVKYGGHEDQLSKKYWGMDRYRIQALEKIIAGNTLTESNKQQAIKMLLKKCYIVKNGAAKRGKEDEAQHFQAIIEYYSDYE